MAVCLASAVLARARPESDHFEVAQIKGEELKTVPELRVPGERLNDGRSHRKRNPLACAQSWKLFSLKLKSSTKSLFFVLRSQACSLLYILNLELSSKLGPKDKFAADGSRALELCDCEPAQGSPNGLSCQKEGWFISNFEQAGQWVNNPAFLKPAFR